MHELLTDAAVRAIRYLTQTRGVNLAGVMLLLQLREAAELLDELAAEIAREPEEPVGRPGEQRVERVTDRGRARPPRNRQRQSGVEL